METKKIEWARAVCYSGYRKGQSPLTKIYPTKEQILEDLTIIQNCGFSYIRMYDANPYAEEVCKVIQEHSILLKLMLGPGLINEENNLGCPWDKTVYTPEQLKDRAKQNDNAINNLIKLAAQFPNVIFSVSVGNENVPSWTENSVSEKRLIEFAKRLKTETKQLVTYNEGAGEWKKLSKLAEYLDVISIHSYPLWNGCTIKKALKFNQKDFAKVSKLYKKKQVIFSEIGWATTDSRNKGIKKNQTNEENQKIYYEQLWNWTDKEKIVAFMFEAFDEPWKGSENPDEVEKHWGIFFENRNPKLLLNS